jgi:hypothetical protein
MYVCMYVHIQVCYLCMYIYRYAIYVCTYTGMLFMYVHIQVCYLCMCVGTFRYRYAIYVCMYIYRYVHTCIFERVSGPISYLAPWGEIFSAMGEVITFCVFPENPCCDIFFCLKSSNLSRTAELFYN